MKSQSENAIKFPKIVDHAEWQKAHDALLVKEKAATRERNALAAERRRLPMVKIEKRYVFDGPKGKMSLLDLFEGRRQLILYHFMFAPSVPGWPDAGCVGCSMVTDQFGHDGAFPRPRYVLLSRVACAAEEYREVQETDGLAVSLVLRRWERFQCGHGPAHRQLLWHERLHPR